MGEVLRRVYAASTGYHDLCCGLCCVTMRLASLEPYKRRVTLKK